MTKIKEYKVLRGIERDGKYRYEPGDTVKASDLKNAPVKAWLESGVLEEVTNGDG